MNAERFFTRHCKAETGVGWRRDSNSHGQIRTKTRRKKMESQLHENAPTLSKRHARKAKVAVESESD